LVTRGKAIAVHGVGFSTPTAAQERVIAAALGLFARYRVGGTSLQMIAGEIGVTEAAVDHQYNTKDEIVLAAAEAELARLEAVIDAAEAERSPGRRRDALLAGIVDLTVARRHTVGTILSDPIIGAFFADHEQFRHVMHRLRRVLMGDDTGPEARVRTAMLSAAISAAPRPRSTAAPASSAARSRNRFAPLRHA
jgi:AcrR family transcriptional regulator